jgi:hypothetical protein
MAAPLSVCTKKEQLSVIRFLWSEGVSGAEIHRRHSAQYGNSVLPQRSAYEWIEKLKNSRKSVTHDDGAGRPSTATTDDIERVRDMVLLDRRMTIDEVENGRQIMKNDVIICFKFFIEIKVVTLVRIIIDSPT